MPAGYKPNFTGVWQLDATKSHMLGRPFTRMIAKIDHREPTLAQTVVVVDANGGRQQLRCEFLTSGEETVNGVGTGQLRSRVSWEGEELLIESWLAVGEHALHFRNYCRLLILRQNLRLEHVAGHLPG